MLLSTGLSLVGKRGPAPPLRQIHWKPERAFRPPRWISSSPTLSAAVLKTRDMSDGDLRQLRVDRGRLMDNLHHTCQWGTGRQWGSAATETGMSRLALSDADKQVRDWFVSVTKALGCYVTVDEMGNIFAIRPGRKNDVPPTYAGSHLDTQPAAGRYDGILGILAGIEMLQVLKDHQVETEFPVGVVNWTNEEGARFPISMCSSGVWAGDIPLARAHDLREVGGGTATMRSELERIGYLGPTQTSYHSMPMAAHFELHIEQGPLLENNQQKIGVVQGVQAYKWYTVNISGREAHTGTTPLNSRSDALLAAAQMISISNTRAKELGSLATTGILTLSPGSTNTIPGHVSFSLDIRAPADETVDAMEATLKKDFARIKRGHSPHALANTMENSDIDLLPEVSVSWTTDSVSPAIKFHEDCIGIVKAAAHSVTGSPDLVRDMTSGAGHDSVYASRRCPTSMIFVPSRRGISHHPEEYTSPEDCALGAEVLLQSVVRYDRMRAKGVRESSEVR